MNTPCSQMENILQNMESVSLEYGLTIIRSKTNIMIVERASFNRPEITEIANCSVV